MFKTCKKVFILILVLSLPGIGVFVNVSPVYARMSENTYTSRNEISVLTGQKPEFTSNDCLACHGVKTEGIPYVNAEHLKSSVHKGLTCTDCHTTIKELPHPEKLPEPNCGQCHRDVEVKYAESIHGRAVRAGIHKAAHCWNCHGRHNILSPANPSSTVYPKNLPSTCGKCHNSTEMADKYNIPVPHPYQLYEKSIHAVGLKDGLPAATCSSCHGVHDILAPTFTNSTIAKANVPKTCGKCHKREYENYIQSSHWKAFEHGVSRAPVCTDCHAEHAILARNNPNSPIYSLNIPRTCTNCHGNVQLAQNFGLPAVKLSTYLHSFHGVMIKGGSIIAANCASCHRAHKILPPSNSQSSVNPKNIYKTCGKCHPGITKIDIKHLKQIHGPIGISKVVIGIVREVYIWLITITIGGMFLYILADFIKKIGSKEREKFLRSHDEGDYIRFNKTEIIIHLIHLFSFFVLAYTGFAHHWPNNWWSMWLTHMDNGLVRAWIHRSAGVVLLLTFGIQFFFMATTKRGKEQFKALLPVFSDLTGVIQLFFYNIGIAGKKPAFGRFTPFEKIEYWALIWGTTIMGLTGMALWFTTVTLSLLPKWWLNLFIVIHFYEAILATLAILVWHLYWVVFDPILYPYNPSMFTGKMPLKIMKEEHPLELAEHEKEKK